MSARWRGSDVHADVTLLSRTMRPRHCGHRTVEIGTAGLSAGAVTEPAPLPAPRRGSWKGSEGSGTRGRRAPAGPSPRSRNPAADSRCRRIADEKKKWRRNGTGAAKSRRKEKRKTEEKRSRKAGEKRKYTPVGNFVAPWFDSLSTLSSVVFQPLVSPGELPFCLASQN